MIRALALLIVAIALAGCASTGAETPAPAPTVAAPARTLGVGTIEGAPDNVAAIFAAAVRSNAAGRGIRFADTGASLTLHGYLSVVSSGAGTLLIYVWDVVDPSGTRLTRLSGQISSAQTAADPWTVVSTYMVADTMNETFDALQAWMRSGTGV